MKKPGKMLQEVLRHLFAKPATVKYPFEKLEMPAQFRGMIKFIAENCTGCKLCMKDCPSNAITISKVGEKRFEATFQLDRCLYCAQCTESCNKKALEITMDYELAQLDRSQLRVTFHAHPQSKLGQELSATTTPPPEQPPE